MFIDTIEINIFCLPSELFPYIFNLETLHLWMGFISVNKKIRITEKYHCLCITEKVFKESEMPNLRPGLQSTILLI